LSLFPKRNSWWLPIAVAAVSAVVVWFSPEERTLGQGIKVVYVHVALTWTGMLGFVISGVLGVYMAVTNSVRGAHWNKITSWVAFACFVVGFVLSLLAAKVNWGDIYWNEPRMISSLQFLAVAIGILMLNHWLSSRRIKGLLSALLAFFMMFWILGSPLVLHPKSPIRESSAAGIQLTFLGLFLLAFSAAAWAAWYWHQRAQPDTT